jgi:hypothetical protein
MSVVVPRNLLRRFQQVQQACTGLHRLCFGILLTLQTTTFIVRLRLNRKLRDLTVQFKDRDLLTVFAMLNEPGSSET